MALKVFLFFYIGCIGLSVLTRLLLLAYKDYPRQSEWTRGQDAIAILVHAGFGAWAFSVMP